MRSLARRVFSSASVKSSVNQPVVATPSRILVVLRLANSGCVGDVRGAADLRLVTADEVTVLGGHQVARLDDVRAHVEGQLVRAEGVLRPVAAGPAVADDRRLRQALVATTAVLPPLPRRRRSPRRARPEDRSARAEHRGPEQPNAPRRQLRSVPVTPATSCMPHVSRPPSPASTALRPVKRGADRRCAGTCPSRDDLWAAHGGSQRPRCGLRDRVVRMTPRDGAPPQVNMGQHCVSSRVNPMCNHAGSREYRPHLHRLQLIRHGTALTPEGPLSRFALIKAVLGPIMRLMFRPRVEGAENIPGDRSGHPGRQPPHLHRLDDPAAGLRPSGLLHRQGRVRHRQGPQGPADGLVLHRLRHDPGRPRRRPTAVSRR